MTHINRIALALSLSVASFSSHAISFNPANGHYYQVIDFSEVGRMNWNEAKSYAEGLIHEGLTGHLATITSQEEDDFVWNIGGEGRFLGGFDTSTQDSSGNWIHNAWQWVTGETFSFSNWIPGEPSHWQDGSDLTPNNEDYLMYWWNNGQEGRWNDTNLDSSFLAGNSISFTTQGFVVEYSASNITGVPLPGALWLFTTGLLVIGSSFKKRSKI
jgi:hypothetical protein